MKSFRNRCQCQQPNEPVIQGYAERLEPNTISRANVYFASLHLFRFSFMLGQFCVHGLVGFRHRNHSGKVRKTVPTTGKFVPTCHKLS